MLTFLYLNNIIKASKLQGATMKYKLLFLVCLIFLLVSCREGATKGKSPTLIFDNINDSNLSLIEPSETILGYVESDFAVIKTRPTSNSDTVTTFFRGKKLELIALIDGWYSFNYKDTFSFINSSDVSLNEIKDVNKSFEHILPRGEYHIENVPLIAQNPDYPTGCEAVTTVMALNFFSEQITVDEFIEDFLDKDDTFYTLNGVLYGPDPNEVYVGDPRKVNSLGCMSPVIEKSLVKFFGSNERVKRYSKVSLESLCAKYVDNDVPVIVWATTAMIPSSSGLKWKTQTNGMFTWPKNEHCMLLVGYDERNYYMNDPYRGELVAYPKQKTETRYKELGSQAIVIEP